LEKTSSVAEAMDFIRVNFVSAISPFSVGILALLDLAA
jgi:hypothetical protein